MKTVLITFCLFLLLALAAIFGVSYSGAVNVAAADKESSALQWLLHTTYENSVIQHAKNISAPVDLSNEQRVIRGAQNYLAMCGGCHTAPGEQPTVLSQGLNPPAPDLIELAARRSPKEAFWVIKNGVKMSGMAAFGLTHEDPELWALVAFLTRMEGASDAGYTQLINTAQQQAPVTDGHHHRHGNEPVRSSSTGAQHEHHETTSGQQGEHHHTDDDPQDNTETEHHHDDYGHGH